MVLMLLFISSGREQSKRGHDVIDGAGFLEYELIFAGVRKETVSDDDDERSSKRGRFGQN